MPSIIYLGNYDANSAIVVIVFSCVFHISKRSRLDNLQVVHVEEVTCFLNTNEKAACEAPEARQEDNPGDKGGTGHL